ncbi:MAG: D-cysteine desulfhydrase family protein [Pseudomonadota bacterium]
MPEEPRRAALAERLAQFPRHRAAHLPTALEPARRLGAALGIDLWMKRDDCTGPGFGGNKIRQLEFYLGRAVAEGADTVLITGAVQSNFVRATAALARPLGMDCHIQLEERVPKADPLYRGSGNVLLDRLLGATLHSYPEGEDEAGADAALKALAARLRAEGRRPYIVPLGAGHPPTGALGYVEAAAETLVQAAPLGGMDRIVVGSGSALTHAGLLVGVAALGAATRVSGICVRRPALAQAKRVTRRAGELAAMLGVPAPAPDSVHLDDASLAPGYGRLNAATREAITLAAQHEGLFLDPVYTGKVMAGLIALARAGRLAGERVVFLHTGGEPALFAYGDDLFAEDDGAQ